MAELVVRMVAEGRASRRSWMAAAPTLELPPRTRMDLKELLPVGSKCGNGTCKPLMIAAAAVR